MQGHNLDAEPLAALLKFRCPVGSPHRTQFGEKRTLAGARAYNFLNLTVEANAGGLTGLGAEVTDGPATPINILGTKLGNIMSKLPLSPALVRADRKLLMYCFT